MQAYSYPQPCRQGLWWVAESARQPETAVSPVAMSIARLDNELIAELEVLLFAEGFKQAKMLGRKPVAAFTMST